MFDKFLVRPYIEDKWTVGLTEHRLDLVDADVAVFSSLILCQGNLLFNGDYSFGPVCILHIDSPHLRKIGDLMLKITFASVTNPVPCFEHGFVPFAAVSVADRAADVQL